MLSRWYYKVSAYCTGHVAAAHGGPITECLQGNSIPCPGSEWRTTGRESAKIDSDRGKRARVDRTAQRGDWNHRRLYTIRSALDVELQLAWVSGDVKLEARKGAKRARIL